MKLRHCWLAALALPLFTACSTNRVTPSGLQASFRPTLTEERIALSLAEQAIQRKNLKTDDRLFFINSELHREKDEEAKAPGQRLIMLTHYRYDGDLTIKTLVNPEQKQVVSVEAIAHLPTPLSKDEFTTAKELALADTRVKAVLSPHGERLAIEPLLVRSITEEDRPQRLVRLLFKVGSDYLSQPIVHVDLMTRKVSVESPAPSRGTPH